MRFSTDPGVDATLETFAGAVRITAVEAIPFAVPYRFRPRSQLGSGVRVLVRVHTDAGHLGQAEALPRGCGETPASLVAVVGGAVNEALSGLDPLRSELVAERCATATATTGLAACGAIDLAVWDLIGDILGVPCHTLLGGFADDVAVAYVVAPGEPAEMAGEALAANEQLGVCCFTIEAGRTPVIDIAAVRAVRDVLPDADLVVAANRSWSCDDAILVGDALNHLGARVRAMSIKTGRTGFTESRRLLDLCCGHDVAIEVGSSSEGALGASATIAFAAAFAATARNPAGIANGLELDDDLLVAGPEIRAGRAQVPPGPGLGFEVDEDRLERCRLDR
jgi:L-alanine-DL-glutamate epimerase-like enolase superfamily enzyme